ncbi:MAG: lipopolysaccharide transport periplasmic protein LptA [Methylophaga sp.]|nr:lipopolysaccharide transport periplasmic protein LptA [Methylophaga sp.]
MHRPYNKLLVILLILLPSITWALPSDREKPIDIEADHAQLDDEQGITQYKGKAILTQGSLRIEGDTITFYYDDNKQLTKAIAQGKFATYQQIQKAGEKPIRAQALQMEYHARSQKIYLLGKGHVWQNGDEFSGDRIEYDITKNIVNASSKPTKAGTTPRKGERIHIIIQPPGSKKKATSSKPKPAVKAVPSMPVEPVEKDGDNYPTAITTTNLNVRTGPGTQYNKLGTFNVSDALIVLTEQKDWLQVRGIIDDQVVIGWVFRRYVQYTN